MWNSQYKKGSDDYLIEWADYCIGDLVKEKTHLYKAYNYYNGQRDHYQYEHLEENSGIGNPTSMSFTPLIRKHIDAIVGEYLTTQIRPKISCKDQGTLSKIFRDKQLELAKETHDWISKFLENSIYTALKGSPQQDEKVVDQIIKQELNDIEQSVDLNFISAYEIAGQNIVQHILQSRKMDFKNKLKQILLDLLIAGEAYYKVVPSSAGSNFKIEIEDPLNTFVDKDPKSRYIKNGYRSVVRKWMTKEEILIKYGDELSQSDIDRINDEYIDRGKYNSNFILVKSLGARCGEYHNPGYLDGEGVHPIDSGETDNRWELIPVYEVEWIDWKKNKSGKIVGNRYEVIRIGSDMYILRGEDQHVVRDMDAPNEVRLNLNGIYYTDGHGAPYSLMLATAPLQDSYDLLLFYKDNIIALSGTRGAHVDLASLPQILGGNLEERLAKYLAYRKSGLSLFDSAQEGQMINTIFNGFDDTVNPGSLQAIQLAIQMTEEIASSITGVFRERLGGIEARDAVANVEVGMQQSFIITKQYYQAMDTLVSEMLTDCLDLARRVYKKGLTGQLVLGDRKQIFTLLPEHYSQTDYDVHISDSAELIKEQETIKQLAIQLAQSDQIDIELIALVMQSKSLTEMYDSIRKSLKEKKIEHDQVQQLQQQLQETQQNMQQMQKQLEASTKKLATLNEQKLNIEQQDNQVNQNIKWFEAKSKAEYQKGQLDLIKERNKLEALQLVDQDPKNDEIVNDKY